MQKDAILLIGYGAPDNLDDIPRFLEGVVRGIKIPPERLAEVLDHYKQIGGGSPFNRLTFEQADALRAELKRRGRDLPLHVGMRHWHPFLKDVVQDMANDGVTRAITVILAPHQGIQSWGKYEIALAIAMQPLGAKVFPAVNIAPWFAHPKFIEAVAARVAESLAPLSPERRAQAAYIFTAHSIPVKDSAPYPEQVKKTADLVGKHCQLTNWTLAYQSRSGNPRDPWLEPDVLGEIARLAAAGIRDIVCIPIGFICDHVEVLYDLDIEARKHCEEFGVKFHRVPTVGSHPRFIEMLADLIEQKL
jgi:ferrochelatase